MSNVKYLDEWRDEVNTYPLHEQVVITSALNIVEEMGLGISKPILLPEGSRNITEVYGVKLRDKRYNGGGKARKELA